GAGTTFTVWLRRAGREADAPAPENRAPVGGGSVLVVEDEPGLRDLLASILEHDGYQVATAGDGRAGIELLEREHYSLVLSDVAMPESSGWDLARAAQEHQPAVPVVFVSGWADTLDPARLAAHGVRGVVAKPFVASDIQAAVAGALANQGPNA